METMWATKIESTAKLYTSCRFENTMHTLETLPNYNTNKTETL